jgi:hypothetical protein
MTGQAQLLVFIPLRSFVRLDSDQPTWLASLFLPGVETEMLVLSSYCEIAP